MATAAGLGLLVSVLLGGVAADRLPRRALLIAVEAVPWAPPWRSGARGQRAAAAVAPGRDRVRDRCGRGVLLPGLHGAAAHPDAPRRAAGGQRCRGHAAAGRAAGGRARGGRAGGGGVRAGRAAVGRRAVRRRPAGPAGHARPRRARPRSTGSSVLCDLGEGFRYLSAPAGCSPRWPSPACTCWFSWARSRCCCRSRCATRPAAGRAGTRSCWPRSGSAPPSARW